MTAAKRPIGARETARRVLQRVRRDEAYATLALAGALERARLSDADRGLATELVYGSLRRRRLLDHALAAQMRRPLEKVDPEVLDILRLAAYQLLFLDRVPAYAAVNEAVGAVRRLRGARVGGFANAVLRAVQAKGLPEVALEGAELGRADGLARLALKASVPDALAAEWVLQLGGEEALALGAALLEPAPLTVRVNRRRSDPEKVRLLLRSEGAHVEKGRYAPHALRVGDGAGTVRWRAAESPSFQDGLWTVQDEAAQLVSLLLDPQPGERVLDACCGLGGKTTHLAELLGTTVDIGDREIPAPLGVDINPRKLELLEQNCRRLGLRAERQQWDLTSASAAGARYDAVLVDAPCSGLGVLRRHPELKWRASLMERSELVALQRRLLEAAIDRLAPGGRLVYAVCTTSEAEGREQRRWLSERFPELELDAPTAAPLTELAPQGELRLWPHRHDTDGFYALRVRAPRGE